MCLYIEHGTHRFGLFSGKPRPIKLEEPLTVYKVLLRHHGDYELVTPFQSVPVEFDKGLYTMQPFSKKQFKKEVTRVGSGRDVDYAKDGHGYHAYKTKTAAERLCMGFESGEIYECIIPAGAYVYYGDGNEICSSEMIITNKQVNLE